MATVFADPEVVAQARAHIQEFDAQQALREARRRRTAAIMTAAGQQRAPQSDADREVLHTLLQTLSISTEDTALFDAVEKVMQASKEGRVEPDPRILDHIARVGKVDVETLRQQIETIARRADEPLTDDIIQNLFNALALQSEPDARSVLSYLAGLTVGGEWRELPYTRRLLLATACLVFVQTTSVATAVLEAPLLTWLSAAGDALAEAIGGTAIESFATLAAQGYAACSDFMQSSFLGAAVPTLTSYPAQLLRSMIRPSMYLSTLSIQLIASPLEERLIAWLDGFTDKARWTRTATTAFARFILMGAYSAAGNLVASNTLAYYFDLTGRQASELHALLPTNAASLATDIVTNPEAIVQLTGRSAEEVTVGQLHDVVQAYVGRSFPLEQLPAQLRAVETTLVAQGLLNAATTTSATAASTYFTVHQSSSNPLLRGGLSEHVANQQLRAQTVSSQLPRPENLNWIGGSWWVPRVDLMALLASRSALQWMPSPTDSVPERTAAPALQLGWKVVKFGLGAFTWTARKFARR
jgi:hypothetical protein